MSRFLDLNRRICRRLDRILPYPPGDSFWDLYAQRAAELAEGAQPQRIVDIGAGRTTPYAELLSDRSRELIGVDVLGEDLCENRALTQRVVCDLTRGGVPAEAHGAGLITSRMVLEHLPDLDRFAAQVRDALAPGGSTIHLFAGRYSAFAILNSLLPEAVSRRILFALRPESVEVGGFRTYYDKTNAGAAEAVFRRAGLADLEVRVSYQVSQYFNFFVPLFVLARLWESAVDRLGLKNLGSYVLLYARRPEGA
jgi:SAM-dependent methyltransferase